MKNNRAIKIRAWAIYLFCIFIAFLAGNYFSPFIFLIFIVLLIYPVISFILLAATYFNMRLHQDFSNEHPVKGQDVKYTVYLSNEFLLPFPNINIEFKSVTPAKDMQLPSFSIFLKRKGIFKEEFDIRCPFRGIYTVGLEAVTVEDLLHFIQLKLKVWHKTFYVYPRILPIKSFRAGIEQRESGQRGIPFPGDPDFSMFDQLKDYRPGESIRHIYWKKFAITGNPVIKEFESSMEPVVKIYFDMRKPTETEIGELEIEDTSVEILVALANFFLEAGIHTQIKAPGRDVYKFTGTIPGDFKAFYNSTTSLIFQDTISLAYFYKIEEKHGSQDNNSIFFITHILDIELFNLVQSSIGTNINFTIIFNQSGFPQEKKERNNDFFFDLRNRGVRIITVNSSTTIVEDLESEFHER